MSNQNALPYLKIETHKQPKYAVVWLHGLGADGYDFVPVVKELEQLGIPPIRFIFPHAPEIPVSINSGYVMPAWYDIKHVDLQRVEDEAGIRASAQAVEALIQLQINSGIPSDRIVLAGFSQGGAITYHVGLRGKFKLAGLITLSTYLALEDSLNSEKVTQNLSTPVWAAHGMQDDVVLPSRGEKAVKCLRALQVPVEWHTYRMAHSVCSAEIEGIAEFLNRVFK